jgi:hypothetical protein
MCNAQSLRVWSTHVIPSVQNTYHSTESYFEKKQLLQHESDRNAASFIINQHADPDAQYRLLMASYQTNLSDTESITLSFGSSVKSSYSLFKIPSKTSVYANFIGLAELRSNMSQDVFGGLYYGILERPEDRSSHVFGLQINWLF